MPKLFHIQEDIVVREYPLNVGDFTVGRNPGNTLHVDDGTVSGEHAVIHVRPSPYLEGQIEAVIEDLDSTNGTRINGRRIDRHRLKHDDLIQIGSLSLRYFDEQTQPYDSTRIFLPDDPEQGG